MQAISNDPCSFQCKGAGMDKTELLSYMRARKLAVIGTTGPDGSPQGALVGVAVTDDFHIIFDTVSDSRKHQNLQRDTRIAATFTGPGEQTLQVEGRACRWGEERRMEAPSRRARSGSWHTHLLRPASYPSLSGVFAQRGDGPPVFGGSRQIGNRCLRVTRPSFRCHC